MQKVEIKSLKSVCKAPFPKVSAVSKATQVWKLWEKILLVLMSIRAHSTNPNRCFYLGI